MADAQLRAVITAQDNASQVIAKVGGSLDAMKSKLETATEASKKVALGLAGFATVAGGFAAKGVQVAGQLEAMRQGFVTLLGSAEAADKTMARIKEEAARTPFELPGLTSATQALALVTKDGDKAINVLLDVGKALATAGKGQAELDRIIANLQQIALTGKITEMDIRQFGMNGINILELLAEYYGTTTEKAGDMVKESSDAFGDLTKAFQKAGSEGGKFADGFKNQAGTFNQLWSNLSDTITIALSDFVKNTGVFDAVKNAVGRLIAVLPTLINYLESDIKWLKEHKEILPIIAGLILGALTPAIYAAVAAFAGFAVALLPFVAAGGALAMLIKGIKNGNIAFTAIASGLLTLFIPTIIGLATTIWMTAIPAITAFIIAWGPLLLAGAVVSGVVAGVLYIIKHWEELKAKAIEIWGKITSYLSTQWNSIVEAAQTKFEELKTAINTKIEEIEAAFWKWVGENQDAVTAILGALAGLVAIGLVNLVNYIQASVIPALVEFVTTMAIRVYEALISFANTIITQTIPAIISMAKTIVTETIPALVKMTITFITQTIPAIIAFIIETSTNAVLALISFVVYILTNAIPALISFAATISTTAVTALQGLIAILTGPVGVVIAFAAVILILSKAVEAWQGLRAEQEALNKTAQAGIELQNKLADAIDKATDPARKAKLEQLSKDLERANQAAQNAANAGFFKNVAVGLGLSSYDSQRAGGGAVDSGRTFLVGEHGPELFTPSTYGQITRSNQLGNGGIIVNVYGDVSGSELIDKVKRGIMNELKQNVLV